MYVSVVFDSDADTYYDCHVPTSCKNLTLVCVLGSSPIRIDII